MIKIVEKSDCVGCEACVQRCPKQCIVMKEDAEGFLYPQIDIEKCIDCGLCERVCPVINQGEPRKPLVAYAAKNQDESVRLSSSSGGVFTALAEYVVEQGGVVFGARIDAKGMVFHDFTESREGIATFRGSKYVQSRIGNAFRNAEKFLKEGRMVLFSGTPCQIAALYFFLRKGYDKLITIDFICHGVPSPGVFRRYLSELKGKFISIDKEKEHEIEFKNILFRDKVKGWNYYSFSLEFSNDRFQSKRYFSETLNINPFLKGFLANLYLRPSCYRCPAKQIKSGSDFTIGDYWGVKLAHPELDDDKGVSAVLVNTDRGVKILQTVQHISLYASTFENVVKCNPALMKSAQEPAKRPLFFELLNQYKVSEIVVKLTHISFLCKMQRKIRRKLSHFFRT